ncbi:hypothetical protein XENOCAPTIV_019090 [Xenoophorus captivus]|uniref:Protein Flattop n=1 Tax=Xenoophorus captivus TaxID=1517983 RepID=A0ABV0RD62_9TELE
MFIYMNCSGESHLHSALRHMVYFHLLFNEHLNSFMNFLEMFSVFYKVAFSLSELLRNKSTQQIGTVADAAMSSSFSANQYDSAFKSKRLQNWCEAKSFKERPSKHVGHTSFVADSRGHLLPGVKKGSAWPDFKGTWDLPSRIPAHHINKTARSAEGLVRLESWGFGQPKKGKSLSDRGSRISDVGEQVSSTLIVQYLHLLLSAATFRDLHHRLSACIPPIGGSRQGAQGADAPVELALAPAAPVLKT